MKVLSRCLPTIAALAIWAVSAPSAHADLLLPSCSTIFILESNFGVMDCPVSNLGTLDVTITSSFVFSVPFGPDFSDELIGILGVGDQFPVIPAGGTHDFQYILFTPLDSPEPISDSGVNVVSPIYSGDDINGFVPGSYLGGAAYVLDFPDSPFTFVPPPPPNTISTRENYDMLKKLFMDSAGSRGTQFEPNSPEPASSILCGFAFAGLMFFARKRAQ